MITYWQSVSAASFLNSYNSSEYNSLALKLYLPSTDEAQLYLVETTIRFYRPFAWQTLPSLTVPYPIYSRTTFAQLINQLPFSSFCFWSTSSWRPKANILRVSFLGLTTFFLSFSFKKNNNNNSATQSFFLQVRDLNAILFNKPRFADLGIAGRVTGLIYLEVLVNNQI